MKRDGALRVAILTVSRTALRRNPHGFSVPSLPDLGLFDTLNTYSSSIATRKGKLTVDFPKLWKLISTS